MDKAKTINVLVYSAAGCSHFALGMVLEPFALSNRLATTPTFHLEHVVQHSEDELSALEAQPWNWVVLVADVPMETAPLTPELTFLKHQIKYMGTKVLAVDCGVYWLAAMGISSKVPLAVHWHESDHFKLQFPNQPVANQLFQQSPTLISCAGKLASLDAVLHLIGRYQSAEHLRELSDHLCLDRIRSEDEKQRLPGHLVGGATQPRLTMALELMEQNLEEPLSTDDIADLVHISRRQLERLFKQYLNTMPAKHYLGLRLAKAKKLLLTTNMSIVQIGLSCGFSSGPHFSSSYKAFYQITPREERSRKLNIPK